MASSCSSAPRICRSVRGFIIASHSPLLYLGGCERPFGVSPILRPGVKLQFLIGGSNCQLSVADITYIRLRAEFVYLAVILDAYSRRVIGWELPTKKRSFRFRVD